MKQLTLILAIVLCSFVAMAQTTQHSPAIEFKGQSYSNMFTFDDSDNIALMQDDKGDSHIELNGIAFKVIIKNNQIIADKPYKVTYDLKKHTVFIFDGKKHYNFKFTPYQFKLTGLKLN